MVKTLVLVRHGKAEDAQPGVDGALRELTRSGARALAATYPTTLSGIDAKKAVLWSSPAVRALQTAAAVSEATGIDDIVTHESLYTQDIEAFLAEMATVDADTLVVVGHVPFVGRLTERLTGVIVPFDKGAAAAISNPLGEEVPATVKWVLPAPDTSRWDTLESVDAAVAHVAEKLKAAIDAFWDDPSEKNLFDLRYSVRRMRSVLAFLRPWHAKKQAAKAERLLRTLQDETTRLRTIDIFATTVRELVDAGELGENSLLPTAVANERQLEVESLMTALRKHESKKPINRLMRKLSSFKWKKSVAAEGISEQDFRDRFDEEMARLDGLLFGLDLASPRDVRRARRDAREVHYVASRLGIVLGEDRAAISAYMDDIQTELGALAYAAENRAMAKEFAKSPRFQGVRSDLGIVARDQAEVVSATLSAVRRREARKSKDGHKHKHED